MHRCIEYRRAELHASTLYWLKGTGSCGPATFEKAPVPLIWDQVGMWQCQARIFRRFRLIGAGISIILIDDLSCYFDAPGSIILVGTLGAAAIGEIHE